MSAALLIPALPRDRSSGAQFALSVLRLALGFYVLFFPLGMSLREVGAVLSCVSLAAYYVLDWRGSNLRRFPLKWVFFAFLAVVAFKIVHTTHFPASLYAMRHNFYKGPLLLLAGLEAVREPRHLRALAWPFIIMTLYCGLDGIYQQFAGVDFIFRMPDSGRLNAMWETGRIGNLVALTLPASLALPVLLPRRWPLAVRLALTLAVLFPGVFLWVGAKARSGWLGLVCGLAALAWLRMGKRQAVLVLILAVAAGVLGASYFPKQLALDRLLDAPRFVIWKAAVDVWLAHPLLGVGVNCFEHGYKALGIVFDPAVFDPPIPHPHNVYLQFLAETGLVGFAALLALLVGNAAWAGLRLRAHIKSGHFGPHWIGACFWAAQVGYMVTALTAHNFYRTWWLGMSMLVTGLALGAALARWKRPEGDA